MTTTPAPYGDVWGDPEQVAALVEGIRENAARLGLIWRKLAGTVAVATDSAGQCMIRLDGDPDTGSTLMPAVTEIGSLAVGTRVWCLWAPPQGLYVTGRALPVSTSVRLQAGITGTITVTAATSATVTVTLPVAYPSANYSPVGSMNNAPGNAFNWHTRCTSVGATAFTVLIMGPNNTFTTNVNWIAALHGSIVL